jgi:DNA repair photolyase
MGILLLITSIEYDIITIGGLPKTYIRRITNMTMIYEPKGKAREYSPLALNLYLGCEHGCKYCYAPSALQRARENYFKTPVPRANVIENLKKELAKNRPVEQVLLSFIGDVYGNCTDSNETTRQALELLLEAKAPVAILTKAGLNCLVDIQLFKKFGEHIQVGASLTFDNKKDSLDWEPGAATPENRLKMLESLHKEGIKTFASFEPVVDPTQSLNLMIKSLSWVDVFKIGKINHYQGLDKKIDWTRFLANTVNLLRNANKAFYIKHDLRIAAPSVRLFGNEVLPDEHNVY